MTNKLAERLRTAANKLGFVGYVLDPGLLRQAAAEIDRLRAALWDIHQGVEGCWTAQMVQDRIESLAGEGE